MELRLSPDKEALLSRLAQERGAEAQDLAQRVLEGYLEEELRFAEAVLAGEAALARGESLTHEEMGLRMARLADHG